MIKFVNGQYYDVSSRLPWEAARDVAAGYTHIPGVGLAKSLTATVNNQPAAPAPVFSNPFGTAMSGTQSGTLQPFVNRNTQMANNALYGGLLGYQPQQLKSGDAGGTRVNPMPPQWKLPSAIPNANQAQVGLLGPQAANYNKPQSGIFGNRAWMEY
jgi:hypothetical protein